MLRGTSKALIGFFVFLFLFGGVEIGEEKFGGVGLSVAQLFDPATKTKAGEPVVLDVLIGAFCAETLLPKSISTKDAGFEALVAKLRGSVGS